MENQPYAFVVVLAALLLLAHMFDGCIDTPQDCREMCNGTPANYRAGVTAVGSCVCAQPVQTLDGGV